MPLQTVYGETRNRGAALELARRLESVSTNGTVYLGYPVLASADARVEVDALLVSEEHGLVAFQLAGAIPSTADEWAESVASQDQLFGVLDSSLRRHDSLRRGRRGLLAEPATITVFPGDAGAAPADADGTFCSMDEVVEVVSALPAVGPEVFRALEAALQRVSTIKPSKRRTEVRSAGSRGAKLKQIEKGIANLDQWQKRAAIENPEGPQRIRGLAGSGKTVVLALKAAYLHAIHPEWNIAVTYYTRALFQQFEDLITRFSFEHSNDRPDFDHLRVMHSWGSARRGGVYYEIARALGVPPRDWAFARAKYGMDEAFTGVCAELLAIARQTNVEPIYDAVLVDEAQDLPAEFFQLLYMFTKEPKRIVWGYDELQRLSEVAMPSTTELFGTTEGGASLVTLANREGEPQQDILLPVCYRNTPWALATAHAVGFGVYRQGGLVQHFDDPAVWEEIGYRTVHGRLEAGHEVTLERSPTSFPAYFPELLEPSDAVSLKIFDDEVGQDAWLAESIADDLGSGELEHDDILVVLPNTYTSKGRYSSIARALQRKGLDSHLVGVTSSADEVFVKGSIAVAHIYRAKGNEAPMVYVVDAQYMNQGSNRITRRNIIFTAITRSRAWVRISAYGGSAAEVSREIAAVEGAGYRLQFPVPSPGELALMRRVHRDRGAEDRERAKAAQQSLERLLAAFEQGELDIEDLPAALRARLRSQLLVDSEDDPDF